MAEGVAGEHRQKIAGGDEETIGRRWQFCAAIFDEASLELAVNGVIVEVERKPLEVLGYLLRHAGKVVAKDELAENLWPGRILTESVLSRTVSALRSALGDEHREIIKTVHGLGYRFVAQVKVQAAKPTAPVEFSFAVGDSPPSRPHCKFAERLGTGNGATWLARHEQTHTLTVFKFALDQGALASFKRQVGLHRALSESSAAAAGVARILDWNLEEAPYFLETEYLAGRSLTSWFESQGGLDRLSLEVRLELAIQLAQAVAAAHSAGVLHQGLKPGNVLVDDTGTRPQIKLCDFGNGGLVDPAYVAPELIRGATATHKTDVYALGVILYQLLAGDFRKPLTAGWELDIPDELLRKDVADAAHGDPELRIPEAGLLVERLRGLERRKRQRAAAADAKQRDIRNRAAAGERRWARIYAAILIGLTVAATTAVAVAQRSRAEAAAASSSSKALHDFLNEDVFALDSSTGRPREITYRSLLERAAAHVDIRFVSQREAAANVHWLLARRFQQLGETNAAVREYEVAARLFTELHGRDAEITALALKHLAWIYADEGKRTEALALACEIVGNWYGRHASTDLTSLLVRIESARIMIRAGSLPEAERELNAVLNTIPRATGSDESIREVFKEWAGFSPGRNVDMRELVSAYANGFLGANVLAEYGDRYQEAETRLREALRTYRNIFGDDSELTAEARLSLGVALSTEGKYEEAEALIVQARAFIKDWFPPTHVYQSVSTLALVRLRLEQRRAREALELSHEAVALCTQGCSPRIKAEHVWGRGLAHEQLGHWPEAIADFRAALVDYEKSRGPQHVGTLKIRVSLADTLRKNGDREAAHAMLEAVRPETLAALPRHPVRADWLRVHGLLELRRTNYGSAATALDEAARILEQTLGPDHWRTHRARDELARAKAAASRAVLSER